MGLALNERQDSKSEDGGAADAAADVAANVAGDAGNKT